MRYSASVLSILAAGLWLGGIVMLAICAMLTFKSIPDRTLAGAATSRMFVLFANYQLACAGLALLGAFLAYVATRSRSSIGLFALFAIGAVAAVAYKLWLIPRMEVLREAALSSGPEFARLHKFSESMVSGTALVLLVAIILIPATMRAARPTSTIDRD